MIEIRSIAYGDREVLTRKEMRREGSENHRAIGKIPSISKASSGHSNPIKAQIEGIRAQTSGSTSPTKLHTPDRGLTGLL